MAVKALKRQHVPPLTNAAEEARVETILAFAGPLEGRRALIAAAHGLELFCTLIRHGCLEATWLKSCNKADRPDYDLMLVPDLGCLPSADDAIRIARHALAPSGRVVIGVAETAGDRKSLALTRRLRLNGFRAIRAAALPGFTVVRAEAPQIGRLS